ncbi:MAG: glycoside hydrolase family 38 C-terminal domain-containing protein, partial [Mycobacteriales bacterium]
MTSPPRPPGRETVHLVPHTHWDREWYEPFQRFRMRLVDLLDDVLDRAERQPQFHFTLDGQMAAVDDYLEVRPENTDRVRALVATGQLAVGPWQILLDEFLCSGESIIRNLELGWSRAQALGGGMPIGYLPDMFGHCAQMPQILAGAGFRHACVWRGVPAAVDRHSFRWVSPDGSWVRTEYLPGGYGNAAFLFDRPARVEAETAGLIERMRPWFGSDEVLAMYGTDHAAPLPGLVDSAAGVDGGLLLQIETLHDYVLRHDPDQAGLPAWHGELRSHARANILPGVISVRAPLKHAMGRAERMVERYSEPWAALWSEQWPGRFLDMAWERLISSACHDSVTGCGVDETAVQVTARIAEAEHLGQAVRDRVVAGLARRVPADALLVMNPSPAPRPGWVEATVPVPGDWPEVSFEGPAGERLPAQELSRPTEQLVEESLDGSGAVDAFSRIHGRELFGRTVRDVRVEPGVLTFVVGPELLAPEIDLVAARLAVQSAVDERPDGWVLRIVEEPRRRLLTRVPVPALGWTAVRPVTGAMAVGDPVRESAARTLDNGVLSVQVRDDGNLRIATRDGVVLDGAGRLVDGGDCGDTYNYGPPATDSVVDTPEAIAVRSVADGPLMGAFEIERGYVWPVQTTGERRSADTERVATTTRVELRAGEPFVRLSITVDNRCRDHRLRLHVPVARAADESHAEGQFAVTTRGRSAEAGYGEVPIPTFPAYGFVDAGGAAVLLASATEYELVGDALAITLLRSTGKLSRNIHPYRADPAGPELDTPQAQCPGVLTTSLALMPHAGEWHQAG